jgi:hypothetical protein
MKKRRVGTLATTHGRVRFSSCLAAALLLRLAPPATADEAPTRLVDDQWPVRSAGRLALDGGLIMGPPPGLQTGLSTGFGAGLTYGRRLALGVRASWSTATESSLVWTVTHDDYRLRAVAVAQQPVGRGTFGLRLGLGTTVVHEDRTRNQGAAAGLTGGALATSALAALPAGDLEAVVSVHVAGPWLLTLSGGPSAFVSDGAFHAAWIAALGAGWQP